MRLLSTLLPLADLSSCLTWNDPSLEQKVASLVGAEEDKGGDSEEASDAQRQVELNQLVSLLEMVAVRHASAESLEMLIHLAPKLTKEWNLAKPLSSSVLTGRIYPQLPGNYYPSSKV